MTSLVPRKPYSKEELEKLYPKGLQLELVQVFLRHGERTPVSSRFTNAGLHPYWPYCNAARNLSDMAATKNDLSTWVSFQWRREMERFGDNDQALVSAGPNGESEGMCQAGELTDTGRQSTLALGQRLRHLYVEQLGFMPGVIANADQFYLRSTPIPRALESLQQAFWGMYPSGARTADFTTPTVVSRTFAEETLFPNESNCHRFRQLARLFAQQAADKWNESEQIDYLNKAWSKWMPPNSPRVAVDSRPRLSGIMDTINSTLAHGPNTRLPSEFYDPKARQIGDKIITDEWFAGYKDSPEYRKLGIGALMGDVTDRMVATGLNGGWRPSAGTPETSGDPVKFAMSGCHDTTIAAILTSLGAFEGENWPPYTSSIAIELFKDNRPPEARRPKIRAPGDVLEEFSYPVSNNNNSPSTPSSEKPSLFSRLLHRSTPSSSSPSNTPTLSPSTVSRVPISNLPTEPLHHHYVRIRYNDRPVRIPGCAENKGNHLPGDETFCTLEAFKTIVDRFTPGNWREECGWNVDKGMYAEGQERAGY